MGLSESSWLVADALRAGVANCGVPAIFYVDNGCGFKNDLMDGPGLGLMARLGVTKEHSLPYNSQTRGVIENFNKICWVREARGVEAYVGLDMDKEARQAMYKASRAEVRLVGKAKSLMDWKTFVAWVRACVAKYNAKPHFKLPMIRDPETGRKRHRTPNEQWAALADQAEIILESQDVLNDLFRPYEVRTVRRCLVSLFNNEYYSPELQDLHGREVMVGYDIHDPTQVWIRDMDERLVCVAELNGHAEDAMQAVERVADFLLEGFVGECMTTMELSPDAMHGLWIIVRAMRDTLAQARDNARAARVAAMDKAAA